MYDYFTLPLSTSSINLGLQFFIGWKLSLQFKKAFLVFVFFCLIKDINVDFLYQYRYLWMYVLLVDEVFELELELFLQENFAVIDNQISFST